MTYKQLFTAAEAANLIAEFTGDDKFYLAKEICVGTRLGAAKIYDSRGREGDWAQVSYGIEYDEGNPVPLRFSNHPIHFHQLDINALLNILGYHPSVKEKILNARPLDKSGASPTTTEPKQENATSSASSEPNWVLNKPQRYRGYRAPLYHFLAEARSKGLSRPTARDVVEAWRKKKPAEIESVQMDGLKYYDSKGSVQAIDLEAIRRSIGRLVSIS